ncbi:hypothetical protein BDZ45DRAFT_404069 [Acephala macrosclerotiorum]|nr:hypothetical protein BDZ45DRAFT_404069 [Acephala macrosclerotiorum]
MRRHSRLQTTAAHVILGARVLLSETTLNYRDLSRRSDHLGCRVSGPQRTHTLKASLFPNPQSLTCSTWLAFHSDHTDTNTVQCQVRLREPDSSSSTTDSRYGGFLKVNPGFELGQGGRRTLAGQGWR